MSPEASDPRALEARSGLAPWTRADLPDAPMPRGLGWLAAVGPGVIVLGVSIGSGEFLLGPAVFVRHGLTLLWVTTVALILQTIFNTELMRYTLATGEPVFTGFMRTRPSSTFWAWFYSILYFLQVGWPAWAANAAGAVFFLYARRLAGPGDAGSVYWIGVAMFLLCVVILLFGRRIERTLELLNWVMVVCILGSFLVLALLFVPAETWLAGGAGLVGLDSEGGGFSLLPVGVDWVLLAALVAYSGAGGVGNVTLTNWARDRGYGMGERVGYIPAAVGGKKVQLAHTGFMFAPDEPNLRRWHGWWRIVRADQWGVFFVGGLLGMLLPALIYVAALEPGTDIRGLGIAAALASAMSERAGALVAGAIAFLGAWLLFKTQLDSLEGMVRALTDMLWTGSSRLRAWRGGDVRLVYYSVLGAVVLWGMIALRLAQPIVLLQIGANVAGVVFIIASLHLLWVNTRLLPSALRPPLWRRGALVFMALFYGAFSVLSAVSLFG
ncbi:MAG TPA: Nramp family divalent metal transporter [Thermoanaerobaculia bacterium]|nr:Nramp family divalent metal transporter [Thermoanaerobaculia bacterium]